MLLRLRPVQQVGAPDFVQSVGVEDLHEVHLEGDQGEGLEDDGDGQLAPDVAHLLSVALLEEGDKVGKVRRLGEQKGRQGEEPRGDMVEVDKAGRVGAHRPQRKQIAEEGEAVQPLPQVRLWNLQLLQLEDKDVGPVQKILRELQHDDDVEDQVQVKGEFQVVLGVGAGKG